MRGALLGRFASLGPELNLGQLYQNLGDEYAIFIDGNNNNLTDSYNLLSNENETFQINDSLYLNGTFFPSGYSLPGIIIASIFAIVLMLFVVIGNLLVIVAIMTEKNLTNCQHWFIASLAVADFFLGVVIIPFSLANELMGYWVFGSLWCDIHSAMDVLLCTASINNLCLISLDRYWSITQAIEYLKKRTRSRAMWMIAAVWIISACVCIPPLLGWKGNRPSDNEKFPRCELSKDMGYVLYSALGSFYIPSCIMVFVYIKIYYAAKARARRGIRKSHKQIKSEVSTKVTSSVTESTSKTGVTTLSSSSQSAAPVAIRVNEHGEQVAELSPPIPIVTCDLASDASTSDHLAENTDARETHTLKVQMSTSSNGDPRRNRTHSTAIEADMVSEFEPSSSDSGAIQNVVTKPLKSRFCRQIFKKSEPPKFKNPPTVELGSLDANGRPRPLKPRDPEKEKRRLARKKEKRATLIVGLIMGSFIFCWLPFFTIYVITPFCDCDIPRMASVVAFWLGYINSALNPVIYTIFNKDFRKAFRKIICK